MPELPHPDDVALLGLDVAADGQSGRFELRRGLVRHDGALYGGTGLAVAHAAKEAATDRPLHRASTQFVGQVFLGRTIEWSVERLAVGKRAAQLLVRATAGDDVVFVAIGSTGTPAEDGLTGQYVEMPKVGGPEAAPPRTSSLPMDPSPDSWTLLAELREAEVLRDDGPTVAFWARRRDGGALTPAALAFVADMVPLSVARAAGKMGAGSSLDNSMRFRGGVADTPWVLLALEGDFAHGGFGHGSLRMWTQDGALVATGSQSASMRYLFEPGQLPNMPQRPASA